MKLILQIALSVLVVYLALFGSGARAVEESTPSSTPDVVTQNIKERLKETITGVNAVESDPQVVGYVGTVRDIVQNTIILEDKYGKKNVLISDDADIFRSPGNAEIKLDSVKIDDGIIAIGIPLKNNDELQGKRVIVSESPFTPPQKTSGIATITKVTNAAITLSALGSSSPIVLDVTSKTMYKTTENSLEYEDLSVGDTVIYTAVVNPKDTTDLTATVIMQVKAVAPEESASASASPKSSPKASPKASPLASPAN